MHMDLCKRDVIVWDPKVTLEPSRCIWIEYVLYHLRVSLWITQARWFQRTVGHHGLRPNMPEKNTGTQLKLYELRAPENVRCWADSLSSAHSSRRFIGRGTPSTFNCKIPWLIQLPQNLGWLDLNSSVKSAELRNGTHAWMNSCTFPHSIAKEYLRISE